MPLISGIDDVSGESCLGEHTSQVGVRSMIFTWHNRPFRQSVYISTMSFIQSGCVQQELKLVEPYLFITWNILVK